MTIPLPTAMAYSDKSTVRAGETVTFFVHVDGGADYRAEFVRLVCGDTGPKGPGLKEEPIDCAITGTHPGREQLTNVGSYVEVAQPPSFEDAVGFEISTLVWATRPGAGLQILLGRWDAERGAGWALALDEAGAPILMLGDGNKTERLSTGKPLPARRWHRVMASWRAGGAVLIRAVPLSGQGFNNDLDLQSEGVATVVPEFDPAPLRFAAGSIKKEGRWFAALNYDGKLEAPMVATARPGALPVACHWDFSADISGTRARSSLGPGADGVTVNTPKRGVKGSRWDGTHHDWRAAPHHYAAIHFHCDDLYDAQWAPSLRLDLPKDMKSGIYALKVSTIGPAHYVSLFVAPQPGTATARVAFLASTVTYQAYADYRRRMDPGPFELAMGTLPMVDLTDIMLAKHTEIGASTYDVHPDGSGVCFASMRRPQFNLRPTGRFWNFAIDLCILDWLEAHGVAYDVITDHDLHDHGAALLAPYGCVLSGCHPEYHSTEMMRGLEGYLEAGGRFMYLGGNGFYWRVSFDPNQPGLLEVRRAEDGTRAWAEEFGDYHHQTSGELGGLWRRLGTPPNKLFGIGFIAQGFDNSSCYRRKAAADDPRAAFIFDGVPEQVIGDFGAWGDGAAGLELDCADVSLGTPDHALVVASSEEHSQAFLLVNEEIASNRHGVDGSFSARVRADMTFFETPSGGAVFSTGSIAYPASLWKDGAGYDNPISKLTMNVVRRFADPAPFSIPSKGE
ncbi:MAG: N,N-dimethylformamidase beta subunit family domain-containing protein [Elsteraceae bacterium]